MVTIGYLLWKVGCVLSCDSPQEPSCFSSQTQPLEGDKLRSDRYTHSAFEHLKYSSKPSNTWMQEILFSLAQQPYLKQLAVVMFELKMAREDFKINEIKKIKKKKRADKTYWYPTGKSLRLQSESSVSIPKQSMVMEPATMGFKSAFKRHLKYFKKLYVYPPTHTSRQSTYLSSYGHFQAPVLPATSSGD